MAKQPTEKNKEVQKEVTKKTKPRRGYKLVAKSIFGLVFIGSLVFGGYFFREYTNLKNNPPTAEEAQKTQDDKLIARVGKLYTLPNEKPLIFFIRDKSQLNEQEKKYISSKAESGDYQLTYIDAKLALLFRPSTNQLVDVQPLNVISSSLKVAIIGTEANRNKLEEKINTTLKSEFTISAKTDAKNAYKEAYVIDLSGKNAEQSKKLAAALGAKVANLPEGETKPEGVDILVIGGASEVVSTP